MTRRDARRAELFRRLDAACAARRGEPPSPPPPHFRPPPPEEEEEEDLPIWPPRSRFWALYRSLKCMNSEPENSQFGSPQNSMSIPSEKKQELISGNYAEQGDSPECETQMVTYNGDNSGIGQDLGGNQFSIVPTKPRKRAIPIDIYAAQCAKCFKWRIVPTKEKYEAFRAESVGDLFVCEKAIEWKPDITCNDPADIYPDDSTCRWAMDKHNIPQAPPQWERLIKIRGEGGTKFADVYYVSPNGKTLRSSIEVEIFIPMKPSQHAYLVLSLDIRAMKLYTETGLSDTVLPNIILLLSKWFLKDNPRYVEEGVKLSQFSFKAPTDYVKKRLKMSQNDGAHTTSTLQPEEVQPLAFAPPPMEDDQGKEEKLLQLVLYDEYLTRLEQPDQSLELEPGSTPSATDAV
ncbi:hypothetical protein ACP4OV_017964 [Aristida adscensionis]